MIYCPNDGDHLSEEISKTENIENEIIVDNSSSVNNAPSGPDNDITPSTNVEQKNETTIPVTEKNELNAIQQELVPSKPSTIEDSDTKGIQLVTEKNQIIEHPNTESEINTEHELIKTTPNVLKKEPGVTIESPIGNIDTTELSTNPLSTTTATSSESSYDANEQTEKAISIPENNKTEAVTKSNKNPSQSTESILKSIQDGIERTSLTPLLVLDPDNNSPSKKDSAKNILLNDIPEPSLPLNKVDGFVNQ